MKKYIEAIAVALSGIGVYFFDKIWGSNIDWSKVREFKIGVLLSKNISVLTIIVFVVLLIIIWIILRLIFKDDNHYNRKQRKLQKINNSFEGETDLLSRWRVSFSFTGDPFISHLEFFCTKHSETPLRFINNRCPNIDCPNHKQNHDITYAKNHIESYLINEWDKLNKVYI